MSYLTDIPKELQEQKQWVCAWENSKCPMRADEITAASSSDPETWCDFETAVKSVEAENYDYVGYVFADNGYVGIDIDAGFEDGFLTPLAVDIISRCKSYTEKSKSGRGVHIILKGTLPFSGKNNLSGVEIYKSRRFFITTGNQMIFSDIVENQKAIDYVLEKYFSASRTSRGRPIVEKIYHPVWKKPEKGKIPVRPEYPEIREGGRNISLTSVAGAMWNAGYSRRQIYLELQRANRTACKPCLSDGELQLITESISRYTR